MNRVLVFVAESATPAAAGDTARPGSALVCSQPRCRRDVIVDVLRFNETAGCVIGGVALVLFGRGPGGPADGRCDRRRGVRRLMRGPCVRDGQSVR